MLRERREKERRSLMYNLSVQWVGGGDGGELGEGRRIAERKFGGGKVGWQNEGGRELEGGEKESYTHVFPVIHYCAKYCQILSVG